MSIKIQGGTPYHGGKGLCHSCKFSHVYRAAAESDIVVRCRASYEHPIFIHKPVVECSEYANKLEKSEYEMKQIAWVLISKGGKPIGFVSSREARRKADNKEIDDPGLDE